MPHSHTREVEVAGLRVGSQPRLQSETLFKRKKGGGGELKQLNYIKQENNRSNSNFWSCFKETQQGGSPWAAICFCGPQLLF